MTSGVCCNDPRSQTLDQWAGPWSISIMCRQPPLLLVLVPLLGSGCFDPDTSAETEAGATGSTSTSTDPSITTTSMGSTGPTTTMTTTGPSTSASTGPTSSTTDTTTGPTGTTGTTGSPAECMNGDAEPGELCLGTVILSTPVNPVEKIANGDFDGNGVLDLLTSEGGDAEAAAYLGAGDGTFPGYAGDAFGFEPLDVAVGHFNDSTLR